MKRKNLHKIIAGTLIPPVLASSCTSSPYFFEDADIVAINKSMAQRNNLNKIAIPINLNLNSKDQKYLKFIDKLASDIIKNPLIAEQFVKDPQAFLAHYKMSDIQINLDEGLLKVILALGDKDINKSLENNDISLFLSLCSEKGVIAEFQKSDLEMIQSLSSQNPEFNEIQRASAVAFAAAFVVGVVVAVWGAAVTHAAVVNAAAGATVAAAAAATVTVTLQSGSETTSVRSFINERDPELYQIWKLKKGEENTYMILSEYEEKITSDCITSLQKYFPEQATNIDVEQIRQLVALNLNK